MPGSSLIVFPDAEDTVRRHLTALLDGVPVFAAVLPRVLPPRSVAAIRTGGIPRSLVWDIARVSFDCRDASTPSGAWALAERARGLMLAAGQDGWVADVACPSVLEVTGPYLNPDPLHPTVHRYTFAVEVALRGASSTE